MVKIKTTTLSASIVFPCVDSFDDYHDIGYAANGMFKLLGQRIKYDEVAFDACGMYWGVFYVGRKPAKAIVNQLLTNAGYEADEDEDEDG